MYDGLDLPDPGYGQDDGGPPRKRRGLSAAVMAAVAVALIAAFLVAMFR
jgi:hypothetical protein